MTTDANELREAIAYLKAILPEFSERGTHRIAAERVIAGAAAYADSLPREVPVATWALVDEEGDVILAGYDSENQALTDREDPSLQPVRLTGTAVIPPREKD